MGVFNSLFGKKNTEEKREKEILPWIPLVSNEQLDDLSVKSTLRPQVIFKHSTTCGISRMVLNIFTQNYTSQKDDFDFHFLDLHRHREVSNAVAQRFEVMHESPQLLVIKNEKVAAHDSHGAIADIDLRQYL